MKLKVEQLEERKLLTTLSDVFLDEANVIQVVGTDDVNEVSTQKIGRVLNIQTRDDASCSTSFENLAGDRSDVTNFTIGDHPLIASFNGNIAGTRGFPPGYNTGAFALITVGSSSIDFNIPSRVSFAARDIIELTPDVVGTVTFVGLDGSTTLDVPSNGDPQSGNWTRFDSDNLNIGLITSVLVDNGGTGVTNLDDLTFSATVTQNFQFVNFFDVNVSLGGGNDIFRTSQNLAVQVDGGEGDDVISGSNRNDTLSGGGGNDVIHGYRGDDLINGDDGDDVLLGYGGDDTIIGGGGDDQLIGGGGDNTLIP